MSVDDQKEAARLGAFIEHAYIGVFLGPNSPAERFRPWRGATVEQIVSAIRVVGVESSILGQRHGRRPDWDSGKRSLRLSSGCANWE